MEKQAWSVNGAMAAQSAASEKMVAARNAGTTWGIFQQGIRLYTVASESAARAFVGRSKRYTIAPDHVA